MNVVNFSWKHVLLSSKLEGNYQLPFYKLKSVQKIGVDHFNTIFHLKYFAMQKFGGKHLNSIFHLKCFVGQQFGVKYWN